MGLGPEARALLEAAAGGDDPSDDDAARVRAKLAARLAMTAAAGTAATVASKTVSAGTTATVAAKTVSAGTTAGAGATAAAGATAGAGAAGLSAGAGASLGAKVLLAVALTGGGVATSVVALRSEAPPPVTARSSEIERPSAPATGVKSTTAPAKEASTILESAATDPPPREPRANAPPDGSSLPTDGARASAPPPLATAAPTTHDVPHGAGRIVGAPDGVAIAAPPREAPATAEPSPIASASSAGRAEPKVPAPRSAGARAVAAPSPLAHASRAPDEPSGATPRSAGAREGVTAGAPPSTRAANETPDAPAPGDTVTEEAALLRAARSALARGDGATALAKVEEHAARFPRGALVEERQAARVFALCAVGRAAEARAAASAFVASSPRSPLAAQVRRSCATAD